MVVQFLAYYEWTGLTQYGNSSVPRIFCTTHIWGWGNIDISGFKNLLVSSWWGKSTSTKFPVKYLQEVSAWPWVPTAHFIIDCDPSSHRTMFSNVYAYASHIRKGGDPDARYGTHCSYCCEPTDPYKVRQYSLTTSLSWTSSSGSSMLRLPLYQVL